MFLSLRESCFVSSCFSTLSHSLDVRALHTFFLKTYKRKPAQFTYKFRNGIFSLYVLKKPREIQGSCWLNRKDITERVRTLPSTDKELLRLGERTGEANLRTLHTFPLPSPQPYSTFRGYFFIAKLFNQPY